MDTNISIINRKKVSFRNNRINERKNLYNNSKSEFIKNFKDYNIRSTKNRKSLLLTKSNNFINKSNKDGSLFENFIIGNLPRTIMYIKSIHRNYRYTVNTIDLSMNAFYTSTLRLHILTFSNIHRFYSIYTNSNIKIHESKVAKVLN